MVNRRRFNEEEVRNIGRRVRACRVLTGATQEEFATKYGFSYPSLKAWEFGKVIPRLEGIDKLIVSWKKEGVFVQKSWIINGDGTGPSYRLLGLSNDIDGVENQHLSSSDEEFEVIFRRRCKKLNQNPIFSTIDDDEMYPYFSPGDKIAGVMVEFETMSSFPEDSHRPVLIKKPNGSFAPRWIHFIEGRSFIQSNTNRSLTEYLSGVIGNICWHAYGEDFLAKK